MSDPAAIVTNLGRVRENIARAARRSGRRPEAIRLVAVTKLVPWESVLAAVRAGATDFGENRVQEGAAKRQAVEQALEGATPGAGVLWHLIGHLQTNKAGKAARSFDLVHSVDSVRVAEALSAAVTRDPGQPATGPDRSRRAAGLEILLEVNVAGEESKFGVAPEEAPVLARAVAGLPGLSLRGLMTVAPLAEDPETVRPVFRRLAGLRQELEALRLPGVVLDYLSMGMSQDYEVAVAEGANLVRIGTAIFGPRGG